MHSTLSQLPFFSEDRVDGLALPPKPASICQSCWEGHFSCQLWLPVPAMSTLGRPWLKDRWKYCYSYSTTLAELRSRAIVGCVWCQLLLVVTMHSQMDGTDTSADAEHPLDIMVHCSGLNGTLIGPELIQVLDMEINSEEFPNLSTLVHTSPGMLQFLPILKQQLVGVKRELTWMIR